MDWISITIYIVMALFVVLAVPYLWKLSGCSRQLKGASAQLKKPETGSSWRDLITRGMLNCREVFRDKALIYQMELYQAEISDEEMGGGAYTNCDIGEFFNSDLLDHIGNRTRCEQTANALTALGILGTFLGLASGLKGFNFSDTSHIINGIENLLQGMSTAFWTSIVGIIASLIFTMIHQKIARTAQTNLDSFLDLFRRYVLDDQTDTAVKRIVEELAVLEDLDTAMATAVGEAVGRHMDGQMDRIISAVQFSCEEMARSQKKTMEELTASQTKALDTMVKSFTESLRTSLGTHFDDLGQSIDRASAEYAKFAGELSLMTSAVDSMRLSMEDMQKMTSSTADDLADFSRNFGSTVSAFDGSLDHLQEKIAELNAGLEERMTALDGILEHSSIAAKAQEACAGSIRECCSKIDGVVSSCTKQTEDLQKISEKIADASVQILSESQKAMQEQMTGFAQGLKDSNKEFLEGLQTQNRSYQASLQTQMDKMTELVDEQIEKMRHEKRRGLFGRR